MPFYILRHHLKLLHFLEEKYDHCFKAKDDLMSHV